MTYRENTIMLTWLVLGLVTGIMLASLSGGRNLQPLVLGPIGAGVGYLLILRLRRNRRP
jgi:uncharacterized membrane protein YeaQ/YmgE (transglycosylase-associated protein family)